MKLKLGKLFLRIDAWVSGYDSHREKKFAASDEHKPYIRPARSLKHLPNGYTHTRWIPKVKNWKHRSKVKHQWEKHKISYYENDKFNRYDNEQKEVFYHLSKLKNDDWLYVKYGSELYYAALQLVLTNKIEGYFTCAKHEFDNFGVKEVNYSVTLTHIRNKVSNENNN